MIKNNYIIIVHFYSFIVITATMLVILHWKKRLVAATI